MDYQATEKFKINAGFTYNNAKDRWNWGDFTERATVLMEGGSQAGLPINESTQPPGAYAPVNYDTWDQNNFIDSYSDLSYEQYQFNFGGTYDFTDNCYTTASFTYDTFNSNQKYVYGDEDGDAFYSYLAFGYRF